MIWLLGLLLFPKNYTKKFNDHMAREEKRFLDDFSLVPEIFGPRYEVASKQFNEFFDHKTPSIVSNIFSWDRDLWTDQILKAAGNNLIEYDARDSETGSLNTFETTLSDFISIVEDNSDHYDSIYFMNEDILTQHSHLVNDTFYLNSTLYGEDLFKHFPPRIKPRMALIIGGTGSRSFLHADPYAWTGWNYLVEGRKLCKHFLRYLVLSSLLN